MRLRFATLPIASLLAVALVTGPVAASPPFPSRIDLPSGWRPEGITAGPGTVLFAGSLADGAVARIDVRTAEVRTLVAGSAGLVGAGVEFERRADRIWVAGGPTGQVRAYDASSGALLATYTFPGSGFLNDVVATRRAIYVTDSNVQQLAVIPLGEDGGLPAPAAAFARPLTGDLAYTAGFNANGIVAKGRWLVVVQSNTGKLFRVDPTSGATRAIDLGGASVTFGDGLELRGSRLYVVRNQLGRVDVFKLLDELTVAEFRGTLTSPGLDVPTTAALQAGQLWAVNARFSTPPGPGVPYWITRLPAKP